MTQKRDSDIQILPDLPVPLYASQCVYFPPNEILICGGYRGYVCYSYNIEKQQYKSICAYPGVELHGHTVVSYAYSSNDTLNCNNPDNNNSTINLISFGGSYSLGIPRHTLMMTYKSVWNNKIEMEEHVFRSKFYTDNKKFTYSTEKNQWMSLPNRLVFGDAQKLDLIGARALIGGSNQHLLFITRYPKNIDVVDLNSFKYIYNIKNTTLPVSENNHICNHCFVSNPDMDGFILMSEGETFLIRYNEIEKEFTYQQLSSCQGLKNFHVYGFGYWNHAIFIFGGCDSHQQHYFDDIWTFEDKDKNWSKCHYKMPFAIEGMATAVNEKDSAIHIIGGWDNKKVAQTTHYVLTIWRPQVIGKIIGCWFRETNLKIGWIFAFDRIVSGYVSRNTWRRE